MLPTDAILAALIAFLGAFTQGMTGFGFGLVSMALLPLLLPMAEAVPLVAVWSFVINLGLLYRLRAHVDLKRVAPLLLGAIVGVPLGVFYLDGADDRLVRLSLGAVMVAWSLWALLGGEKAVADRGAPPGAGLLAGVFGGVLSGAFNTGGPPTILYVNAMGWDKDRATSTLQAFFTFASVLSLSTHASVGLLDLEAVRRSLPVVPVVMLGTWLGAQVYDRIPQERFRTLVLGFVLVLGLQFLVRAA